LKIRIGLDELRSTSLVIFLLGPVTDATNHGNEELKFYDAAMLTRALMIQWKASISPFTGP
jgi:hypothetical protein